MSILMTGRVGDICLLLYAYLYLNIYTYHYVWVLFDIIYVCMNIFVYFSISSKYYKMFHLTILYIYSDKCFSFAN